MRNHTQKCLPKQPWSFVQNGLIFVIILLPKIGRSKLCLKYQNKTFFMPSNLKFALVVLN